ncbi:MAG: hypothetical protein KDA22_02265, partial [Phycisphaerales bacterium]|nr:hypothetical protein [Phycisphaerales bacterium]
MQLQSGIGTRTGMALAAALAATCTSLGVDLTVSSVEVNQAIKLTTTTLVGNKSTFVRVKVGVADSPSGVANVDGLLHIYADGVEIPGSPFYSNNGPITAPLAPSMTELDATLNFEVLPPISDDVDFVVELNPGHLVVESDFANNGGSLLNQAFKCRDVVELAYVPVNYTPGGGVPPAWMMAPGMGDNFLRGIYSAGEWNYHVSPLPPLLWTQNINNSNNSLLNTLKDIRINQIPAAGYDKPDFIYGWLPGNPYSGNGQAIGIPGDAAFGNTEATRYQRTFAHETGHLIGQSHNNTLINTVGIDVEHHLWNSQSIAQVMPTSKKDVMWAGQLTTAAWVAATTYNKFLINAAAACASDNDDAGGAGGNGNDAPGTVLRICGEIDHATRQVALSPVFQVPLETPTADDPNGDVRFELLGPAGDVLATIGARTNTSPESCNGEEMLPSSPFYVFAPMSVGRSAVAGVRMVDVATGAVLGERLASAGVPSVENLVVETAGNGPQPDAKGGPGQAKLTGTIHVSWEGVDADGDPLTYNLLYSPDNGGSWLPVAVNLTETSFQFESNQVPSSKGGPARFRVRTSDGFNNGEAEEVVAMGLGDGNPPFVYLVAPNGGDAFPQHACVILHAAAWDMEDLMLNDEQILWTSSLDGVLGTGVELPYSDLSVGLHTVTVTGIDSDGMETSDAQVISILPRTIFSPDM